MINIKEIFVPVFFLIGIVIIFQTFLKRSDRITRKAKEEFLEREREASFSRVKEIEQERFINIDINNFPIMSTQDIKTDEEKYAYTLQTAVIEKSSKKMAHFDEENLELKKMYGASNLETIIQYEENYTEFLRKLSSWAKALVDANKKDDAIKVLEEGMKVGLDYTKSIMLLADLYNEKKDNEALNNLYNLIKQNKSIIMDKVVKYIENLLSI